MEPIGEVKKKERGMQMLYATVRQRKIHVKNPVTVIRNGVGVDELMLDMDEEWKDMTSIICVFTLRYTAEEEQTETVEKEDGSTEEVKKTVTVEKKKEVEMFYSLGEAVLVPADCLKETGSLSVSCTGYVDGEKVMTTMLPDSFWEVVQNGPVTGDVPMEATPTLYEQVVSAAGAAQAAAQTANAVATEIQKAKEQGKFDGISPTVEVGTVAEGTQAQVVNSGTPTAVVLDFVLPRGPQGLKGERGLNGRDGKDGSDAQVTMENIAAALGYHPAPWPALDTKVQLPSDGSGKLDHGMAGQFAISDGRGGIIWQSLTNVGEVGM